jgi:hypothetical protein
MDLWRLRLGRRNRILRARHTWAESQAQSEQGRERQGAIAARWRVPPLAI